MSVYTEQERFDLSVEPNPRFLPCYGGGPGLCVCGNWDHTPGEVIVRPGRPVFPIWEARPVALVALGRASFSGPTDR